MEYRESIKDVKPYVPGLTEEEIKIKYNLDKVVKIASNENPYGPTNKIKEAFMNMDINIYPDNNSTKIRKALASKYGILENTIAFGNGSVEIIQMLSRILLEEGDNIVTEIPSFSSYFSEAMIQGAEIKTIVPNAEYSFNLAEMLDFVDSNTKMIYITNPNNPLGTIVTKAELLNFISNVPSNILVVLDEAYAEFVEEEEFSSMIKYVKDYPNLCVLRTFSKAYGLANLRIGYIVANSDVIIQIEKVRVPFNVSTIAQDAAVIALEDEKHLEYVKDSNREVITNLYSKLDKLGLEYIRTQANFVMINFNRDAKEVCGKLLEKGVIIRGGFPLMDTWARVSVGTQEEMDFFINCLEEVL